MVGGNLEGFKPPADYEEDAKGPLVDFSLTDSTELWLIQWPANQLPDFEGKEVSLKLHHDGNLGSFEGSSGKQFEIVNFASQDTGAVVFLSSAPASKIVGKIERHVSVVHYPDPEVIEKEKASNLKKMYLKSMGISLTSSSELFGTPTSVGPKNSHSSRGHGSATQSSRQKCSLSESREALKFSKRR